MAARTGRAPGHGRDLRAASHVGCAADARPGRPATPPLSGQGPAGRCGGKSRRASQGDELGYLCLFPDHIVGAEQVSQEQVELLLLRRGRRHCARREREREREKEGGETGAVRRAGGPAGGAGAGPARGPAPAAARDGVGRAGKGGAKGKGKNGAGPRDPSPPPRPPASAPHWPWTRGAGPRPPLLGPRGLATHPAVPSLAARVGARAWSGPCASRTSKPNCGQGCVVGMAGGPGWRAWRWGGG